MKPIWHILLVVSILAAGTVQAEDEGAALVQMMKERDRSIQDVVRSDTGGEGETGREKLKQIVGELFDYRTLAENSLRRYWDKRTEKEQTEFIDLYRRLLEKNYADPKLYTKSDKIDYIGVAVDGEKATLKTRVHYRNEQSTIDYLFHKVDGTWLIYDMVIDDLSVVDNNYSQFRKEIRKSSYEGLVKKLQDKLVEEK